MSYVLDDWHVSRRFIFLSLCDGHRRPQYETITTCVPNPNCFDDPQAVLHLFYSLTVELESCRCLESFAIVKQVSIPWRKRDVTPLLTQWSCVSFALSHRYRLNPSLCLTYLTNCRRWPGGASSPGVSRCGIRLTVKICQCRQNVSHNHDDKLRWYYGPTLFSKGHHFYFPAWSRKVCY